MEARIPWMKLDVDITEEERDYLRPYVQRLLKSVEPKEIGWHARRGYYPAAALYAVSELFDELDIDRVDIQRRCYDDMTDGTARSQFSRAYTAIRRYGEFIDLYLELVCDRLCISPAACADAKELAHRLCEGSVHVTVATALYIVHDNPEVSLYDILYEVPTEERSVVRRMERQEEIIENFIEERRQVLLNGIDN